MNSAKKKIEELKEKIAELEAELNKPKAMFERAEVGNKYFFISSRCKTMDTRESLQLFNNDHYNATNYYLDEQLAEKVAKYYRDNNWFIRKAIEFADGYEWGDSGYSYCITIDTFDLEYRVVKLNHVKTIGEIYMTKENVIKFKTWLEEYRPLK